MDSKVKTVYLQSMPEDQNMVQGIYNPQRVLTEPQDRCALVVRSSDRTNGNDFDFQIDLKTSTAGIRKIQLAKCILPLLPQINVNNKSVTVTHADGTVTFNLVDGFYSVQALVNSLQNEFTTAWQSLDPLNSVTVSYDIDRRSISIIDNNGEPFFIHSGCPFDIYGENVVKFPTEPAGSTPSTTSIESSSLGMIYSRYITLSSQRLTQDQKTFSVVSSGGASDIVALIDISSEYDGEQFTVSASFPSTFVTIDTLEYSPRINFVNRYKSLKVFDLVLYDEFGIKLSELDTPTYSFKYPVSMWFLGYL